MMKNHWRFLVPFGAYSIVLAIAAVTAYSAPVNPLYIPSAQSIDLLNKAQIAQDAKNWDEMLRLSKLASLADSHYSRAYVYVAQAYIEKHMPCEAIEQCQKMLALDVKKYRTNGFRDDRTFATITLKKLVCPPPPPPPTPPPTVTPPPSCFLQLPAAAPQAAKFDFSALTPVVSAIPAHTKEISVAAWSPDGGTLATASWVSGDGTTASEIALWDATGMVSESAVPLNRLKSHWASAYDGTGAQPDWIGQFAKINALAWSPDGKWLASAGEDGRVAVWDVPCGEKAYVLEDTLPGAKIKPKAMTMAWNSDGLRLMTDGGEMLTYDARADKPVGYLKLVPRRVKLTADESGNWVRVAAFSADGKNYAAATAQGRIVLWSESAHGAPRTVFNARDQDSAHLEGVETTALAFSPDGHWLASANHAHIYLNRATDGSEFRDLGPRLVIVKARVGALAWSADSHWLLARTPDKLLRFAPDPRATGDCQLPPLDAAKVVSPELAVSPRQPVVADASVDATLAVPFRGRLNIWRTSP